MNREMNSESMSRKMNRNNQLTENVQITKKSGRLKKNFQMPAIKSRKDWFIAFVLAFLMIYLMALRYQGKINASLMLVTPGKISYFNQPENHGVYAVTVLGLTILSLGVMIYKKIEKNRIGRAMAAGIALIAAITGSYFYDCDRTIKTPYGSDPSYVSVTYWENGEGETYELDEPTKKQLADLVVALEPLQDRVSEQSEQPEQSEQSERQNQNETMNVARDQERSEFWVTVNYPRPNRAPYQIWAIINGGVIRITKGHSTAQDPIYIDNGLLALLEGLPGHIQ
jgi:hypothetical protein